MKHALKTVKDFIANFTLLSEILFDPTNVVLNSFPAGDCVGDGLYTIVPALGLM